MSVAEVRQSIHSMSLQERQVALAMSVVMDRLLRLPEADRNDLYVLLKELVSAQTVEDQNGICDTMVEILDGRRTTVSRLDLAAESSKGRLKPWVDFVARRLRDARKEARLTQEQLAEMAGLPQSHISRIENGKHSPANSTVEKIAKALNKPLSFFDVS